jgi:WASH complex subunit strumpellin
MREIVDKHFYDNWVVPVFLGYLVDLSYEWKLYEAARKAIKNTV